MTHTPSKPRHFAKLAFAKAQSQFLARDKAGSETDLNAPIALACADTTARPGHTRFAIKRQHHHEGGNCPLVLK
jgi:hypothetical protein